MTVHRYDLKSRKTDVAASGVRFFEVSLSGEKMLTRQGDNWFIRNLPPPPPPSGGAAPGGGPAGPAGQVAPAAQDRSPLQAPDS